MAQSLAKLPPLWPLKRLCVEPCLTQPVNPLEDSYSETN
jgi:hypothetical protein